MWTTNSNNGAVAEDSATVVKCNNRDYNITATAGIALVEKLKAIARDNSIGKFDIFDSTGKALSSADVENGEFISPLSIQRFNVAA
jgi:hypothetical protein